MTAVCGVHAYVPNPAEAYSFENSKTLVPRSLSGWIICRNDPINRFDPDGMDDYRTDSQKLLTNNQNFRQAVRAVIAAMQLGEKRIKDRHEAGCLAVKGKDGGIEMTKLRVGSPIKVSLETVYNQDDGTVKTILGEEVAASLHGHVGNGKIDGVEVQSWKASPEDKAWSNNSGLESFIVVKDDYSTSAV